MHGLKILSLYWFISDGDDEMQLHDNHVIEGKTGGGLQTSPKSEQISTFKPTSIWSSDNGERKVY